MTKPEWKIVTLILLLGGIFVTFSSCAKNYSFETADEVREKTTLTRNRITNVTTVNGPYAETSDKEALYLLTARYAKDQMISCQLVIYQTRVRTRGPAYYYQAFDPEGNKMDFSRFIDTFSDTDEKVGITLSEEKLQASRGTGMEFAIYGKRDELELKVEAFYIEGFLAKAEEVK